MLWSWANSSTPGGHTMCSTVSSSEQNQVRIIGLIVRPPTASLTPDGSDTDRRTSS